MIRHVTFRADVLRGGVPYSTLEYTTPPSVYADATSEIKMTLRGRFLHNPSVDYINDEIRPMMSVDGAEYPLGVYKIVTRRQEYSAAGVLYDAIEAYDRAIALSWAKIETREYWQAGTPYDVIISHYLVRAGIKHASHVPSGHVLQTDREDWDIGTEFLAIVNTLLGEINYDSVWFDVSGVCQLRPYAPPSAGKINHTYGGREGFTLRSECSVEVDLYNTPNVFIAVLENPEYDHPIVKKAENNTPASKLSTISRGLRIPAVYPVTNIASEDELQAYINKKRDESMQSSEIVSIETALMPNHNIGDTIALIHPRIEGLYREMEWSMSLNAGGYMRHVLKKMVIL